MDINDPRRRLRVLNQSSPSLRVAAQPKINITTAQPKQPRLFVGNTQIKPESTARAGGPVYNPERTDQRNNVEKFGDLIGFQPFAEGISQLIGGTTSRENEDSLRKSMQNAELLKQYNNSFRTGKLSKEAYDRAVSNVARENNAIVGDVRETSGKLDKSKFLASAGIVGSTPFALSGFGAKTLAGKVAAEAGIGASQGALNELAANEDPSVANIAKTAGIGAALGGILPAFGAGVSRVMSKLRGGEEGALNRLASKLATTEDTGQIIDEVIKSAPDADPARSAEVARFISTTDDPDAIRAALDELKAPGVVDAPGPVNTDEVVQQVQEPDVRFTESSLNSKQAVKNPAIAKYATGETSDPLTTVINALAKMDDPVAARSVVTDLLPDLSTGQQKRLAQKLLNAQDADEVGIILTNADEITPSVKPTQADLEANTVKTEPQPIAQSEKVKQAMEDVPTPAVNTDAVETPVAPQATEQLGETVSQNADSAAARFPDADPTTQKAIQEVMDGLDSAQSSYDDAAKIRSKEKGQRFAAGNKNYEAAGGGEAGVQAKLAALKGKYSESGFNPVSVDAESQKTILDIIESAEDIMPGRKLNTQNAMRKVWGTAEGKPTPSDIRYIREFFGDPLADMVEQAVESGGKNWKDVLAQAAGTPRALMATGDLSFGLRQGAKLGSRYPKEWLVSQKESVKFAANSDYFKESMDAIRKSKYFELINDNMKVALTGASESTEEAFAAADFAEKIPGAGRAVSAADRAYTGAGTKLRFDVTKKIIDSYGGPEQFAKTFSKKEMQDLGEVVNTLTGRGGKAGGLTEKHMKTLSTTLFAPRLWAANLNFINPGWYARLSPPARKVAAQSLGTFATTAGTVLGLAAALGADVVWDPRSADFAKIKIGNTRYDILGGLQQNIRLGAQLITGQKINSTTGELETIEGGFGKPSRYNILLQAFENKENPLLSFATTMLKGKDWQGNDVNPLVEAGKRLTPLGIQGVVETTKDTGSLVKGVAMNIPSFFGVGTQTYGNVKSKDKGPNGEFAGKVEPNMVTDASGKVMLDDKGKPITVKFEEGATDLEKKVVLDNARDTAMAAEYRKNLSTEDQALLKLNKDERKEYLDRGDISKEKYDQLEQYEQDVKNLDGVDVPDTLKSDAAKNFYRTYNSMTKTRQEAWLDSEADDNSKTIAKELNKKRIEGLPEFKASNKLAKLYADLENKVNGEKLSTLKKEDAIQEFNKSATKLNYSKEQNEVYSATLTDIRSLLSRDKLKKTDMDKAIELDNHLYNSGLISKLKFSKKFRGEYGYSLPSGPKGGSGSGYASGGGRSGGTGGSSGGTQRGYLSALLPSFSTSTKSSKPTISSVSRPIKFASSVKKSGGKGTKKATIKL